MEQQCVPTRVPPRFRFVPGYAVCGVPWRRLENEKGACVSSSAAISFEATQSRGALHGDSASRLHMWVQLSWFRLWNSLGCSAPENSIRRVDGWLIGCKQDKRKISLLIVLGAGESGCPQAARFRCGSVKPVKQCIPLYKFAPRRRRQIKSSKGYDAERCVANLPDSKKGLGTHGKESPRAAGER
jgi:hypothetical protein